MGDLLASVVYMPTFRNTLLHHMKTEQTPVNHPEESIQRKGLFVMNNRGISLIGVVFISYNR
jgi:hypothetical protein